MPFPYLFRKLFQNDGAGEKLKPEIVPITVNGISPSATSGDIAIETFSTQSINGVSLGFAAESTVGVSNFLMQIYKKGFKSGDVLTVDWDNSKRIYVNDGVNTFTLDGGCLYVCSVKDVNASNYSSSCAYYVNDSSYGGGCYFLSVNSIGNGEIFSQTIVPLTKNTRVPAGAIMPFAGTSLPSGYLLCNGALLSRTGYPELFSAIGTAWGAGDGSTTFALPNLNNRVVQGAATASAVGTYLAAALPDITGAWHHAAASDSASTGAVQDSGSDFRQGVARTSSGYAVYKTFHASLSNGIYTGSSVQPPAGLTLMLIKY